MKEEEEELYYVVSRWMINSFPPADLVLCYSTLSLQRCLSSALFLVLTDSLQSWLSCECLKDIQTLSEHSMLACTGPASLS